MNIRLTFALLLSLTIAIVSAIPAAAEIVFRIDPSNVNVVAGQDITLAMVLVDVSGDVAAEGGLFGGGGRLLLADASSATATITDISKISPNAGFSLATTIYPFDEPYPNAPPAGFSQLGGFLGASDFGTAVQTVNGEILLAEFDITVNGEAGDSIELHPAVLGGAFVGNIGGSGTNFDADVMLTHSATITIVPEPSACWAMLIVANVLPSQRRQR